MAQRMGQGEGGGRKSRADGAGLQVGMKAGVRSALPTVNMWCCAEMRAVSSTVPDTLPTPQRAHGPGMEKSRRRAIDSSVPVQSSRSM